MSENKHTQYDLAQMQSLPLRAKITMTKQRIRAWYEHWDGEVFVSFSGGKDSTVLKHMVDDLYSDVPSIFVDTGLEYPEIRQFAKSQKNVTVLRPKMRFDQVVSQYGYPVISKEVSHTIQYARSGDENNRCYKKLFGLLMNNGEKSQYCCDKYSYLYDAPFKISSSCCDVMKKSPVKKYERETGKKPIVGTMAEESRLRLSAWIRHGCNAFDSHRPISSPMSFWTEQDVLHYIKEFDVPYCSVYGDIKVKESDETVDGQMNLIDMLGCYSENDILETTGCKRTGCMFCMFGCHLEKNPNRFQKLKETHPRQYEYCIGGGVSMSMAYGCRTRTVSVSARCLIS